MEILIGNERKEIDFDGTISSLVKHLGLSREEVVVKVNNRLAPDNKKINSNDKIEVIKVVFGG